MKISVIVPVYNVEKYLEKCLESILNQTYRNLEIILVDDGSTDKSGEICDEYSKIDNRIIVIHKKNEGQSIARNTALKVISGQYISFVDSDDILNIRFYEKMMRALKEKEVKLVVCDCLRFKDKTRICVDTSEKSNVLNYSKIDALKELWIPGAKINNYLCNKLYAKELFNDIVLPEKRIFEDLAVMYRIIDRCNNIAFIDEKLYYYLNRSDSSSKKIATDFFIEKINIVNKRHQKLISKYPELRESLENYRIKNSIYIHWAISRNGDKKYFLGNDLYKEYKFIVGCIKDRGFFSIIKELNIKYKFLLGLLIFNKKILYFLGSKIFKYK